MSGFLFLLIVDWIMRKTLSEGKTGIRWRMLESLDDLEYADDIVLLAEAWRHVQEKLNKLNKYGLQTGLRINTNKTESTRVNAIRDTAFTVNEKDIKDRLLTSSHILVQPLQHQEERLKI